MRLRNAAVLAVAPVAFLTPGLRDCTPSASPCTTIYNEFRRQGASSGVASNFAYHIAPRESGCTPQYVHNSTDWSYSRLGLNAGAHGELVSGWRRLCNADVRWDTRILSVDVRCGLAAYHAYGWSPWAT
jgi:hypothetical protein